MANPQASGPFPPVPLTIFATPQFVFDFDLINGLAAAM